MSTAVAPLRRLARRLRGPQANARRAFNRWQEEVEPRLLRDLRVQRFAQPSLTAGPDVTPVDVAVIEHAAALRDTRAAWVLIVDPGDRLAADAVRAFGRAAALAPDAGVITCDEDRLDHAGRRVDPVMRPGPSPDLLASCDLAGGLVLLHRERGLAAAGAAGVQLGAPGWRHALTRELTGADGTGAAHASAILVHRGTGAAETAGTAAGGAPGAAAVGSAPGTTSGGAATAGAVARAPGPPRRPVAGEPSVEVIIPFRDRHDLLERAVGTLLGETAWDRLAVTLIDNASVTPPPARLLSDTRVQAVGDPRPFNFAALCNGAAARSTADVLVFLNNDTEVVEPDWLERLVGEAQRHDVGAVAPLLIYPDGSVQHAGVAVGLFGLAGHPFAALQPGERSPFGTAVDGTRNTLAVSAACMVIERVKFTAAGGFDERFVVAGQDVDLGLRLTARGLRSLCVTDVRVVHDESRTRGTRVGPDDPATSIAAYGAFLAAGDPFYSPALTRASTTCSLRTADEPW